jgi:transcriptional regulator with XRE-family HTH domain|nr:MAG TPA: helix-turn-helix domain protein [Caudoviricetes sp.]
MFSLLDERGLSASGLCKVLGVGTNQTTNWKQRNTDPPAKYIVLICEYLGCSLEYLLTGQEAEKAPVPGMSENGREMLELYERLPEREQLLLLGRLQEMTAPVSGEVKGGSGTDGSSAGRAG